MYTGNAANYHAVFYYNVAGEPSAITHNNVVANEAVMSDVRARLEQAVVANACFFTFTGCTADGYTLPDDRTVADVTKTFFTFKF